jgi:hypothetical protein
VAIGTPTSRGNAGGTTSATTASFTPTANSVLLALISTKSTSLPSAPSISDSLGGTWTKITDVNGPNSSSFIVGALYYQSVGGSPAAMTVSATGGTTSTVLSVIEVTGSGTDFSNFNVNTNTAGDPSCTITAPAAGNAIFGFAVGHLTNAFTQSTGTELFDLVPTGASNHRLEFAYSLSPASGALSWTSTNTNSVGVAFEVKVASTARTLTAASGAFVLSGTAASLKVGRKVAAASASFALSGTAATLNKGFRLTAASGPFALSGTSAALKAGRKLAAASGSFTLSGATIALRKGFSLSAASGSYVLSGLAASLKAARKLPAASTSFVLTGAAVGLSKASLAAYILTAARGLFALNPNNAELSRSQLRKPHRRRRGFSDYGIWRD